MTEWVSEFLSFLSSEKGLSANTQKAYEQDLDQFVTFCKLQKLKIADAELSDLRRFVGYLRRLELSERSIARKSSAVEQFYKFLLREGRVKSDPSQLLNVIVKTKKLPKHLTEAEIDKLLSAADGSTEESTRDRAFLEFCYATGCRISEITHLKVSHLDWKDRTVRLFGKGNRERLVPLTADAIEWCAKYKDIRHEWIRRFDLKDAETFFLSRLGKGLTRQSAWKLFKKYAHKAEIRRQVWPHMIRHSVATHILRNGADLRVVQELMGHKSITTTEVYTHLDIENLRTMQNKFHPRN